LRIATAIMMSGTGSNAHRILEYKPSGRQEPAYEVRVIVSDNPGSNYRRIAEEHGVEARLNDIYAFHNVPYPEQDASREARRALRDSRLRERFDRQTEEILKSYGVRLVALAGYDWIVSPFLCRRYVLVNVHPGDLRVRDSEGRRLYIGLGWVPTAKAIVNGERFVYSTTHLVTAELDGGPIARVSQPVAVDLPQELRAGDILAEGTAVGRLSSSKPLVEHSKSLQQRLKCVGDWVEFPRTLDEVASLIRSGRLQRGRSGEFRMDDRPVKDMFLQ